MLEEQVKLHSFAIIVYIIKHEPLFGTNPLNNGRLDLQEINIYDVVISKSYPSLLSLPKLFLGHVSNSNRSVPSLNYWARRRQLCGCVSARLKKSQRWWGMAAHRSGSQEKHRSETSRRRRSVWCGPVSGRTEPPRPPP